ncbi:hypothetical protein L484_024387 [Morus notabilis]|uniref:Uncharacterized protein n=1 Tax=Morus notabilis TaxID=981085 RepID=W9RX69_9ROSA|nr:hypothetical protein L484_024387 [Morus notabilis]
MSREVDDERRLYQNVRKYDKIVKQNSRTNNGSTTSTDPASSVRQDDDEVFLQTITRFLHELKT